MAEVRLSQLFAPTFREVWKLIKKHAYTHFWFKGGRSSSKSSFIALCIVLLIITFKDANAICFRKVENTLRTSVYEQILWAIDKLGLSGWFEATVSPMEIVYKPTGQKILFRGLDKAERIKSIKLRTGYFKIAWFEELDEFGGMEEIRKATQSLMRGGQDFVYLYSYNPPRTLANWVNQEASYPQASRYVHHSSYLDVPKEWLGIDFLLEAEHLKHKDELAYRHEYLGEAVGSGKQIFSNVVAKEISEEEIRHFDNIRQGIDWGYVSDPFAFGKWHYDKTRRRIYLFDEIYQVGLLNPQSIPRVKEKAQAYIPIYADSAEPKSIADFQCAGLPVRGAVRGPDSRKFGVKWLQSLDAIIIDPVRCPNAYREFSTWELEKNKDGSWKEEPPTTNDHMIDLVRYGSEQDMIKRGLF